MVRGRAFWATDHRSKVEGDRDDFGRGGHLDEDGATSPEAASRYEPLDVPPFVPLWLAFLLAGFVGGVLVTITLFFSLATNQPDRGPLRPLPPAPRLQSAPATDLRAYQAAKKRELKGSAAAVRIDIAVRETAKQGWGPPK